MKRPLFSTLERAWLMGALRLGFSGAFVIAGGALLLALLSYHPSDPGLLSATWRSPRNWLGLEGAIAADLLHRTIGVAGYGVSALAIAWGVRIAMRRAGDRLLLRLFAAPFALLAGAALASTHAGAAASGGGHGGLLGDALFSILFDGLPVENAKLRLVVAAVLLALATPPFAATALGGDVRSATLAVGRGLRELAGLGGALWRGIGGAGLFGALAAVFAATARPFDRERGAACAGTGFGGGMSSGPDFERPTPRRPAPKAPPRPAGAPPRPEPEQEGPREPGFSDAWSGGTPLGPPEPELRGPEPFEPDEPETSAPADAPIEEPLSAADAAAPLPDWAEAARASGEAIAERRLAEDLAERDDAPEEDPPLEPDFAAPAEVAAPNAEAPISSAPVISEPAPQAPAPVEPELAEPAEPAPSQIEDDAADAAPELEETVEIERVTVGALEDEEPAAENAEAEPDAPLGPVEPSADLLEAIAVAEASVEEGWFSAIDDDRPPATPEAPIDPAPEPEALDLGLLAAAPQERAQQITERALAEKADRLQAVLQDYGVRGDIIHVNPGPVVSLFELEPAPGLKASRLVGLADDIARSMGAAACRIAPVPGKNLIGVELPNDARETVLLSELVAAEAFQNGEWTLPLALGKDIGGEPVIADLARMPHLLIAGTTGSGKSVAINAMLLSLFYRLSPEEARLILIDPKMLELSVYNGAPHLLAPVVTDPSKAVAALRWVVREMETRYQRMARLNVRSLESYNARVEAAQASGCALEREVQVGFDEATGRPLYETQRIPAEKMARIVVVIDEMADLMLVAGKEIERLVQRLAQMARASGIHLIMATQRPSVDVITGVIKANFPIRISFQVTSKIDSRTILNEPGAEQLLGKGDMLFTTGAGKLQRLHGPFVSDAEVEAVASALKAMGPAAAAVDFDGSAQAAAGGDAAEEATGSGESEDALYARAVAIVAQEGKCSTSFLQRRLQIGYNRAARLVERMEAEGVVSPANHAGKREVLISPPE